MLATMDSLDVRHKFPSLCPQGDKFIQLPDDIGSDDFSTFVSFLYPTYVNISLARILRPEVIIQASIRARFKAT